MQNKPIMGKLHYPAAIAGCINMPQHLLARTHIWWRMLCCSEWLGIHGISINNSPTLHSKCDLPPLHWKHRGAAFALCPHLLPSALSACHTNAKCYTDFKNRCSCGDRNQCLLFESAISTICYGHSLCWPGNPLLWTASQKDWCCKELISNKRYPCVPKGRGAALPSEKKKKKATPLFLKLLSPAGFPLLPNTPTVTMVYREAINEIRCSAEFICYCFCHKIQLKCHFTCFLA